MNFKADIDPAIRGFWYAPSGDDSIFDGETIERPKKTMQAAIDAASALDPPPQIGNQAVVSVAQGGSFSTGFVLEDSIQFNGTNVSVNTDAAIAVTLASNLSCNLTAVTNTQSAGTCILIDGESFAQIDCDFIGVLGPGGAIGINITGICDSIFPVFKELLMAGIGATGIKITSTTTVPIDINGDVVEMNADNQTFLDYNPVNSNDVCTVDISSVFATGATIFAKSLNNSSIFVARGGHLTIDAGVLLADTIIVVEDGAEVDLICEAAVGDIVVNSGGILNILLLTHMVGTITNDGTINGIIDGVPFGSYQQKHEEQLVLSASDFTQQDPAGLDMPMQIKFGSAQFGPTDPVELDAAGNITINQSDQYNMRALFEFGRTGAGAFSLLLFRILVNGMQLGNSQYAKISTSDTVTPIQFSRPLDLVENDIVTIEMIRDSSGFDAGSIFPVTPALGTVNQAPSASISLQRNRLVQPV